MNAVQPLGREDGRLFRLVALVVGTFAALVAALTLMAAAPSSASAAVEWQAKALWAPTHLPPGGRGVIRVRIANEGSTLSSGSPTVDVHLPAGVTFEASDTDAWLCTPSGSPQVVNCIAPLGFPTKPYSYFGNGGAAMIGMTVQVAPGTTEGTHPLPIDLSGGGAAAAETQTEEIRVDDVPAPFGPIDDTLEAGAFDAGGQPYTQAGGHPSDASLTFSMTKRFNDPLQGTKWTESIQPDNIKDVVVDLPSGFSGNPTAAAKCANITLLETPGGCPVAAQVGIVEYEQYAAVNVQMAAIYNVEPDNDTPAQFAFAIAGGGKVVLTPVVRSDGDWGVSIKSKDLSEANPLFSTRATLWGVPTDSSHDHLRCDRPNELAQACVGSDSLGNTIASDFALPHSLPGARKPFLANPTRCNGAQETTQMNMSAWADPAPFEADGDPLITDPRWVRPFALSPALTNCAPLPFAPSIQAEPTSATPGEPTGLDFRLDLPQNDDPDGLSTAHLKDTQVSFPGGLVVNPSSADGLGACSSGQIGLVSKLPVRFTKTEPSCPLSSKIGTVEVDTPLLEEPLHGEVFLAAQKDNPFDSLIAVYLVVRGPGILGKLAGHVEADPVTGRLTTTVLENPQVPFDTLTVRLKSGPRAPLTVPANCGTHAIGSDMTSWAGQSASVSSSFQVSCPGNATAFDPGFSAGTANPVAGRFSPLSIRMTRDGGRDLGRLRMTMPRGLLASVRDVAVCGEADLANAVSRPGRDVQAAASCPASSQIGTVTVGAGAGSAPFYPLIPGSTATGRMFLTGSHSGTDAPVAGGRQIAYGVAIEVPAVAGPFDLGTVLVRAALYADTTTAELTAVSDKLPRILQGIPLNVRDVRADLSRPGFSLNPTSCTEKQVAANVEAQDGLSVARSDRFQVGDCAALRFRPRLGITLTGRRQMTTGRHPGVRAQVRQRSGEAGIKRVETRLPKSLALDPDNAQALCEFADGTKPEPTCPSGSVIGVARATSPLLKRPLRGKVYFVKNVRTDPRTGNQIRTLPMLVVALRGEIALNLRGISNVKGGKLVNVFDAIPDAPTSQFNLKLDGGKNGILTVTRTARSLINLCSRRQVAEVDTDGHNGKRRDFDARLKTPCGKQRKKK